MKTSFFLGGVFVNYETFMGFRNVSLQLLWDISHLMNLVGPQLSGALIVKCGLSISALHIGLLYWAATR